MPEPVGNRKIMDKVNEEAVLFTDTVAALSTPPGKGGVAVIRITGRDAIPVASRVFRPKSGAPLSETPGYTLRFGEIFDEGGRLDEGLAAVFHAPRSFTGEDVVELSCHGGVLLTEKVLAAVFAAGAKPAPAGEFTRRAYLSGKLGLSGAEAVADLLDAESDAGLRMAAAGAAGALSRAVGKLSAEISSLLAAAYVCGDYPEEDLADLTPEEMQGSLQKILAQLEDLLASYRRGHAVSEGIPCAVIGAPNAGKSSFFNALLGEERAIVSAEAGTTRDTVDATVLLGEVKLRLTDTAGVRQSESDAERQGVERTLAAIRKAELLLWVLDGSGDGSESRDDESRDAEERLAQAVRRRGVPVIFIKNKCDLPGCASFPLPEIWGEGENVPSVYPVCAKTGEGIENVKRVLEARLLGEKAAYAPDAAIVANARQNAALQKARSALLRALEALQGGMTPDVAGLDLEQALAAMLETDGKNALDSVVEEIFHRFCVGK